MNLVISHSRVHGFVVYQHACGKFCQHRKKGWCNFTFTVKSWLIHHIYTVNDTHSISRSIPALKLLYDYNEDNKKQQLNKRQSEPCKGRYLSRDIDSGKDIHILETEKKADSTEAEKQSEVMCLEDSQNSSDQGNHLDMFMRDLYDIALLNREESELEDLMEQVTNLVKFLLKVVGDKDSRMKYQELVPTGSAYDGTKVQSPNEFDYLAVLDDSCGKNIFVIERECKDNDGFAHVKLEDDEMFKKWQYLSSESKLISVDMNRGVCSFREQFRIVFHDTVEKNIGVEFNSPNGRLVLLRFSVSINGPECTVEAQWIPNSTDKQPIDVSIDVCPALKSDQIKIIRREDVPSNQAWRVLNSSDNVYLIPKPARHCSYCFKLVFAEQDQALVKSLSQVHKKCLLVLKYLAKMACDKYFCTKVSLNSFTMKTVLMHHSFRCKTSDVSVSKCIQHVLRKYLKAVTLETPCFPSVFILNRNILKTLSRCDKNAAQISASIVTQILKLFRELEEKTLKDEYDFRNCFIQLQQMILSASRDMKHVCDVHACV